MDQTFFLAANSGQGFFSLYDGFPGDGVFLHVVKGGPGTGKSGFLRRIRKAAQERGLDTETILIRRRSSAPAIRIPSTACASRRCVRPGSTARRPM